MTNWRMRAAVIGCITLAGCMDPLENPGGTAGSSELGYTASNCSSSEPQRLAEQQTRHLMAAFEAEIKNAKNPKSNKESIERHYNLETVQKLVCMANDESRFGIESTSLYVGTFQLGHDTYPSLCPGQKDVSSQVGNARCALKILFNPYEYEGRTPRWTKWPRSSLACERGSSMRRCFDGIVARTMNPQCGDTRVSFPEPWTLVVTKSSACKATAVEIKLTSQDGNYRTGPSLKSTFNAQGIARVENLQSLYSNPRYDHVESLLRVSDHTVTLFRTTSSIRDKIATWRSAAAPKTSQDSLPQQTWPPLSFPPPIQAPPPIDPPP